MGVWNNKVGLEIVKKQISVVVDMVVCGGDCGVAGCAILGVNIFA